MTNSAQNSGVGSAPRLGEPPVPQAQSGNVDNWKRLDQAVWNVLKKAAKGEPIE